MITLAGNASTQSRGRRPLPPGAVSALTIDVEGINETVQFTYDDGSVKPKTLLSWVGGQSGLLWGAGPYPLEIRDAIKRGLHRVQGSYGHWFEWELAGALGVALEHVFTSDKLSCRFFQNGSDALAAAARVARQATGRNYVLSCGYHGAAEEWAHEPANPGLPRSAINNHRRFEWGDIVMVRSWSNVVAAVCIEVPPVPDSEARSFLAECRKACDASGAVFILDEVVTGFRLGLQGAAGYYGVKPDIACYGKAMCATGCVSAIVGNRDLVDMLANPVFYSTTFGGSPGPCAVAAATVKWLTDNPSAFAEMNATGKLLQDGFNALGVKCIGQPERSVCVFPSDAEWWVWCGQMIERGVMVHRPNFPTLNHTDADVQRTLDVAAEVMRVLA